MITFLIKCLNNVFLCMKNIQKVNEAIAQERALLLNHPLYKKIQNIDHLRLFTQGHVYAVWDFMSLLKALQIQLTCVSIPWYATEFSNTRYLINEIVLAEESDEYTDGRRLSHFEMYLDAMQQLGANTQTIEQFVATCKQENDVLQCIEAATLDPRIKAFLKFSFETILSKEPHKIAAAFTFGREDLIPDMFNSILKELEVNFPDTDMQPLIYYFQRHIELDGDEHGPLALQMVTELAGDDPVKWAEIIETSKTALQKRALLWDAISDSL